MAKVVGSCHVSAGVTLPCSWVAGGRCGVDASECDVKVITGA